MPPSDEPEDKANTGLLDHRRTPEHRAGMLHLLGRALEDLHEPPPAASLEPVSETAVKKGDHTLPCFPLGDEEQRALPCSAFAVDVEAGTFYPLRDGEFRGPVRLPSDFHYASLLPHTSRDPVARSPGEKVLKQLTSVVNAQEPNVYGRPVEHMRHDTATDEWRTPDGQALRRAEPHDPSFALGAVTFFFDLDDKLFWIEQDEPGVCKGPYKLPRGFQGGDVSALATVGAR